jgi:hypothetical protein
MEDLLEFDGPAERCVQESSEPSDAAAAQFLQGSGTDASVGELCVGQVILHDGVLKEVIEPPRLVGPSHHTVSAVRVRRLDTNEVEYAGEPSPGVRIPVMEPTPEHRMVVRDGWARSHESKAVSYANSGRHAQAAEQFWLTYQNLMGAQSAALDHYVGPRIDDDRAARRTADTRRNNARVRALEEMDKELTAWSPEARARLGAPITPRRRAHLGEMPRFRGEAQFLDPGLGAWERLTDERRPLHPDLEEDRGWNDARAAVNYRDSYIQGDTRTGRLTMSRFSNPHAAIERLQESQGDQGSRYDRGVARARAALVGLGISPEVTLRESWEQPSPRPLMNEAERRAIGLVVDPF